MKQQKKISKYLQIISIILGIVVISIAGVIGYSTLNFKSSEGGIAWQFVIWTCIFAGCILVMLFHFYKVCIKIGEGKSFSEENASRFTGIERVSYIGSLSAATRVIWCIISPLPSEVIAGSSIFNVSISTKLLLISLLESFAFLIFGFICRALSQLIRNAAAIKEENDLTI